jgi:HAD superfamily hydrolase (TIGR01509 family)
MNAFIFDMDGVLLDNEPMWDDLKPSLYTKIFGADVATKIGPTVGLSIDHVIDRAIAAGATASRAEVFEHYIAEASHIYETAPLTAAINQLGAVLKDLGVAVGVVSASPQRWIQAVLDRLEFGQDVKLVIALQERPDLPHKPDPAGYLEAVKALGATPASTIILEDSNAGIAAAKASGAFTIALRANLLPGYQQTGGADAYVDTISEVIELVKQRFKN